MQLALRPWVTAGVVLTGASMIAVTPLATSLPEVQVPSIQLTSLVDDVGDALSLASLDPITPWINVFGDAFNNVSTIATDWLADPFPLLTQVLTNQLGYGQTLVTAGTDALSNFFTYVTGDAAYNSLQYFLGQAFDALLAGNITGAFSNVWSSVLTGLLDTAVPLLTSGALDIPATMAQNFANIVTTLTDVNTVLPLFLGILQPIYGTWTALGDSLQGTLDAVQAGDPLTAFGDLINLPATVTGAFLNGYEPLGAPGLLSPFNGFESGPIAALLNLPVELAKAIAPAAGGADLLSELGNILNLGDVFNLGDLFSGFDLGAISDIFTQLPTEFASILGDPSMWFSFL
ncbi:hypothetical protein ACAG26_18875 [Mycobacterium sp. pUA109]|uniref:hypothetical protein n=1 Tax=Mycobacterium sp. pUA109 TaxID=3238982 RepID=UPI00351B95F3